MIIKTRYRDIPFEEAIKCSSRHVEEARPWWEARRGKIVTIDVSEPTHGGSRVCGGPFFNIVGDLDFEGSSRKISVCPHIAEIGD